MSRPILPILLACSLACAALTGCTDNEPTCGLAPIYESASGALLSMDPCLGTLALGTEEEPEQWLPIVPLGRSAIASAHDEIEVSMTQGRYVFEGSFDRWAGPTDGRFDGPGRWTGTVDGAETSLQVGPGPRGSIHLHLEVAGDPDRVSLAFGCNEGERFYGLGARPQGTDHTGTSPMLYTAEQGIGQRDFGLDEFDFLNGRIGDSYFPVPWTVTDRGLGVAIGGTPIARMGLCDIMEPSTLRFEAWEPRMDLYLFPSESPRAAVADWTLASGPPVAAPDWAYGPWIAVQRGTERLLEVASELREAGIPATALWAQDWIGGREDAIGGYDLHYHWEWDEELYPDLPSAIEQLHDDGFAFMGYFNPFITEGFDEWDEALAAGYVPQTPEGEPYAFSIVDRYGSVVDLADEEARSWAKGYMEQAAAMGQDGWMCDFGEWLPFDAVVGNGERGQDLHNDYPLAWQELSMEVLNEAWGEGNALCFNRSGWAGSQAIVPITWGGDQETGFGRDDGLPSAREIGVGLGLSGIGRYGSDIAGFSSVFEAPSTRELYTRWITMAAFEPVMRTHDGLAQEENWSWETDEETREIFARYARLHMQLLPLFRVLDREYREGGLPMMRHTILVESGSGAAWEELRDAPDQHFLGDDLLVAPVVEEGALSRTVVLPAGRWYELLGDGSIDAGEGGAFTVDAPLDSIPVLARAGSILPLGDPEVQTSYPETNSEVVGSADRADRLNLVVFLGGSSELVVGEHTWSFDGTGPLGEGLPRLDGDELAPSCGDDETNCIELTDPERGLQVLRVDWGVDDNPVLEGAGWSLAPSYSDEYPSGTVTLRHPET